MFILVSTSKLLYFFTWELENVPWWTLLSNDVIIISIVILKAGVVVGEEKLV